MYVFINKKINKCNQCNIRICDTLKIVTFKTRNKKKNN